MIMILKIGISNILSDLTDNVNSKAEPLGARPRRLAY